MVKDDTNTNIHYLTKAESAAKTAALKAKQEANPNYLIKLTFLKDEFGWYADVPTHTRSQNAMVAGSDNLLDDIAQGNRKLVIGFRFIEDKRKKPIFILKHLAGTHTFGDTYFAYGITAIPFPCYICAVGHDVYGIAPKRIFVYQIKRFAT